MNTTKIGEHIAMLRKNAGFTQESLSERLGVTPQAVSKWERGAGFPDISVLTDLAFALDVSTDDLLKPTETPIRAFMRSNKGLPIARKISGVPKISRWDAPQEKAGQEMSNAKSNEFGKSSDLHARGMYQYVKVHNTR